MATPFTDHISAAVGTGGANKPKDVARIQAYLNECPPVIGGPAIKLKQDGLIGPKTQGAINGFQRLQFGVADGRIDPGKRTEKKLIELELGPQTRPAIHIEAARQQAQRLFNPAAQAIASNITPQGTLVPGAANSVFGQLLTLCFRVSLRSGDADAAATAKTLIFVRQKFAATGPILQQRIRVTPIKFFDMTDDLRQPKLGIRAPLAIAGNAILANWKFTDFDAACGFGTGPQTRAAMFLQAGFIGADFFPLARVTADEAFIRSGFGPSDIAIHDSGNYSFFCQGIVAGGSPSPFFHAPTAPLGWADRPGLP